MMFRRGVSKVSVMLHMITRRRELGGRPECQIKLELNLRYDRNPLLSLRARQALEFATSATSSKHLRLSPIVPTHRYANSCTPPNRELDTIMDTSPLGSLPPELRNFIYELVLIQPSNVCVYKTTRLENSLLHFDCEYVNARAILQTCRQTRQESRPVFFSCNAFKVLLDDVKQSHDAVLESLYTFLAYLGWAEVHSLGPLTVSVPTLDYDTVVDIDIKRVRWHLLRVMQQTFEEVSARLDQQLLFQVPFTFQGKDKFSEATVSIRSSNPVGSFREARQELRDLMPSQGRWCPVLQQMCDVLMDWEDSFACL